MVFLNHNGYVLFSVFMGVFAMNLISPVSVLPSCNRQASVNFGHKQKSPKVIATSGAADVEQMPDTMTISIALLEKGKTEKAVDRQLNQNSANLIAALKALALPETVKLNSRFTPVYPEYDYSGGKPKKTGYQGTFHVSVIERGGNAEEFPKHAAAIKEAVDAMENTNFNGPSYTIYNMQEAAAEALKRAVKDAFEKAKAVAEASGVKIAKTPLSVEVGAKSDNYYGGRKGMHQVQMATASSMSDHVSEDSFQIAPLVVSSEPVRAVFKVKK